MQSVYIYIATLLCLIGSSTLAQGVFSLQHQKVLSSSQTATPQHGRFLHLTDIHMDDHYNVGATITSFCHRDPTKHKKKKARKGKLAGYWGAPATDCDAAPHMVYHSIQWIADEWKDKIDFIVWTGDNARHDTEPGKIRRSGKEILDYNIRITQALQQAFRRSSDNSSIPLVPCLGNNDVHPHNKLTGPTRTIGTGERQDNAQLVIYSDIWRDLIPEEQHATFRHGGYFTVDVAEGIRVFSLNTLYFFDSNDAVGRCDAYGEPGWGHMQWFQQQLEQARSDRVKVYVMGHVPPTTKSFKPDCLEDYTRISLDYQDIIQAHFYGHANMDHFQILHRYPSSKPPRQGEKELEQEGEEEEEGKSDNDDDHEDNDSGYFEDHDDIIIRGNNVARKLRKQYKHSLKKYDGAKDLVVIHVAPPLLPVYNPAFRINEYNADRSSPSFGMWTRYTQWYSDLAYWNREYLADNTTRPSFEVEYSTDEDYDMRNLTTQSWLELANLFVQKSPSAHSLWTNYIQNMVVQT